MKRKVYKFYAIFSYANDGITVTFPDLPGCISCGFSTNEAKMMAKESLELFLEDMKEESIPKATDIKNIVLEKSQKVFLIEVII